MLYDIFTTCFTIYLRYALRCIYNVLYDIFTICSTIYLKYALRYIYDIIQSFACIWLHKGNQYEFLKHPKTKWLDGGLEPPTSELPVHCSTT